LDAGCETNDNSFAAGDTITVSCYCQREGSSVISFYCRLKITSNYLSANNRDACFLFDDIMHHSDGIQSLFFTKSSNIIALSTGGYNNPPPPRLT
jgi:hypothetical protein